MHSGISHTQRSSGGCCHRTKQKYMRIDGSVKTSARQELVNDFQNNSDMRAAVLSIQASGTGLTLTVRKRARCPLELGF
jgi:SNF2 family DNA or RNA helicase